METTTPQAGARHLTQSQAAAYLGFAERTLEAWRNEGTGPSYYRIGRRIRYAAADLDEFLARGRVTTKAAA